LTSSDGSGITAGLQARSLVVAESLGKERLFGAGLGNQQRRDWRCTAGQKANGSQLTAAQQELTARSAPALIENWLCL
jgi:hypothetical protein